MVEPLEDRSMSSRTLNRQVESATKKTDKASQLFDSVFAGTMKSSLLTGRVNYSSVSEAVTELLVENKSEIFSHAMFLPPPSVIPEIVPEKIGETMSGNREGSHPPPTVQCNGIFSKEASDVSEVIEVGPMYSEVMTNKFEEFECTVIDNGAVNIGLGKDNDTDVISAPVLKRCRLNFKNSSGMEGDFLAADNKISYQFREKPVYRHKLFEDDDEKQIDGTLVVECKAKSTCSMILQQQKDSRLPATALRRKTARETQQQRLRSGTEIDFNNDMNYVLSTLTDTMSTSNLKSLSIISLARRCISHEFRYLFRAKNCFGKIVRALGDTTNSYEVAISISCVIYLMSRDSKCIDLDGTSLRLLSQLLKFEKCVNSQRYSKMVIDILVEWRDKSFAADAQKCIQFDVSEENLSPSFLVLESLVYICSRNRDNQALKDELLNLGILQWIVSRSDKEVLRLLHENVNDFDPALCLKVLERCLRILESATVCNKKNQAYLISHRGSILIHSSVKLISYCYGVVDKTEEKLTGLGEQSIVCMSRVAGLLMNMSHENELCSSKLGQISGFLPLCASSFTYLVPKYAVGEKKFDLAVLLCSLLVNLVERCNSNRQKLIQISVPSYFCGTQSTKQLPTLKAFTNLFIQHESLARSVDEELDNDLVLDDNPAEQCCVDDEDEGDGRLNRLQKEITEDEMIETVQKAMNKASHHMEDSVLASYLALLVGCLLQQNEECVNIVKSELVGGKLTTMIDQLQRFLEFMKISNCRNSDRNFIERIIDLIDTLND